MIRRRSLLALLSGLIVGALLLSASPAGAQSYPGPPTITLDKTSVTQGGTVLVTCTGFQPGSGITVTLNPGGVSYGPFTVDANGNIAETITIPPGTALGPHTVECSGLDETGAPTTVIAQLTVTGTTPVTTTGTLPRTGSDSTNLLRIGVVLVVAGAALAIATKRRKNAEATHR